MMNKELNELKISFNNLVESAVRLNELYEKKCKSELELREENNRLNNIINELNCGIKELDDMFYETFRISQNGYYSISEWELKDFTNKLQELKGEDKE